MGLRSSLQARSSDALAVSPTVNVSVFTNPIWPSSPVMTTVPRGPLQSGSFNSSASVRSMQVKVAPVSRTKSYGPFPFIFTGTINAASFGPASLNRTSPGAVWVGEPGETALCNPQPSASRLSSKMVGPRTRTAIGLTTSLCFSATTSLRTLRISGSFAPRDLYGTRR